VIPYLYHEILHVLSQFQAFGAIDLFFQLAMRVILMPVPGNIGASLSEFFPGILGDRAPDADEHIVYPAWRAVQDAAIRTFSFNNALPFSNRRFHNSDFIHRCLLRFQYFRHFFGRCNAGKIKNRVCVENQISCKETERRPVPTIRLWVALSGRSEAPPVRSLHMFKSLDHFDNLFPVSAANQR
jgi:hypothetical protein